MSRFVKALLFAATTSPAGAAPVQCPPTLAVTQTAAAVPQGMVALDAAPKHAWTNVQFYDGPPNEQAWLAPDSTKKSGKTFTNVWTFGQTPGATWISCYYTGTSVILSYRLPATTQSCSVRYDATMSPEPATAIDCR